MHALNDTWKCSLVLRTRPGSVQDTDERAAVHLKDMSLRGVCLHSGLAAALSLSLPESAGTDDGRCFFKVGTKRWPKRFSKSEPGGI